MKVRHLYSIGLTSDSNKPFPFIQVYAESMEEALKKATEYVKDNCKGCKIASVVSANTVILD